MANRPPAFQFYAGDWLSDINVSMMTLEEEGAYIRLLAYSWIEGGLPNDDAILSRLCKGASTTLIAKVRERFTPSESDPSKLVNPRQEKERHKQAEWREKSRQGGIKSAESRASLSKGCFNHPSTESVEPKVNSSSSSSSSKKTLSPKATGDPRFTEFRDDWNKAWTSMNGEVPMPFGARDGKNLSTFLKENPQLSREQWRTILKNRAKSEVNKSQSLGVWIGKAVEFISAPLDRYNKPIGITKNSTPPPPMISLSEQMRRIQEGQ